MAEASIPVDLFNPGQVFACLGFLEAADVLLGNAEGGFEWSESPNVRFLLAADGEQNPFEVALRFLATAQISRCVPTTFAVSQSSESPEEDEDFGDELTDSLGLVILECFPQPEADQMTLPVQLQGSDGHLLSLSHWADGSGRNDFKLYSGNRSGASIARAMLSGTREKSQKNKEIGDLKTNGIESLWTTRRTELIAAPFDTLTPMGGSFNFDPRGAWTGIDAGYSPNDQRHGLSASPVVELLAALGMEHARPNQGTKRHVQYAVWSPSIPPMLARLALAGNAFGGGMRFFRFTLEMSGKNKVVTFAEEESST